MYKRQVGILAALHERETTGKGQKIISGLFETSVFWVGQHIARAAFTKLPSKPMASEGQSVRMGWGIFHLFPTSGEEQVFIGATSNTHWERFCKVFDLPDLFADERLNTNAKRAEARDWLLPRVREVTSKYTSAELQAKLEEANVPYAPVNRPDQLADDRHLQATGQLLDTPMTPELTAGLPKLPFQSDRYEFDLRRPAPKLGEHTREVLAEAGLPKDAIESLVSDGVASTPA